jgi:hypothetical protein
VGWVVIKLTHPERWVYLDGGWGLGIESGERAVAGNGFIYDTYVGEVSLALGSRSRRRLAWRSVYSLGTLL